ncbi:hypothetical protein ACO1O0_002717 [Amphichorda felina]
MPLRSPLASASYRGSKGQEHDANRDGIGSATGQGQAPPNESLADGIELLSEDEFFSLSSDDDDCQPRSPPPTTLDKDGPRTPRSPFVVEIATPRFPEDYKAVNMGGERRLLFPGGEFSDRSTPPASLGKVPQQDFNSLFEDIDIIPATPDDIQSKKESNSCASLEKTKPTAAEVHSTPKKKETPNKKRTPKKTETPAKKGPTKNEETPKKPQTPKKKGTPAEEAPVALESRPSLAQSRATTSVEVSQAVSKEPSSNAISTTPNSSASASEQAVESRTVACERDALIQSVEFRGLSKIKTPINHTVHSSETFDPANPALSCVKIEFRRGRTLGKTVSVEGRAKSALWPKSRLGKQRSRKKQLVLPFKPDKKEPSSDDDCLIVGVSPRSRKQVTSPSKSDKKMSSSDDECQIVGASLITNRHTETCESEVDSHGCCDMDTKLTKTTAVELPTRRLKIRSRAKRGLLIKKEARQPGRPTGKEKEPVVLDLTMVSSSDESGMESDDHDHGSVLELMEVTRASPTATKSPQKQKNLPKKVLLGPNQGSLPPDEPDAVEKPTSGTSLLGSDDDSLKRGDLNVNRGVISDEPADAGEKIKDSVKKSCQLDEPSDESPLLRTPSSSSPGESPRCPVLLNEGEKEEEEKLPRNGYEEIQPELRPISSSPTPRFKKTLQDTREINPNDSDVLTTLSSTIRDIETENIQEDSGSERQPIPASSWSAGDEKQILTGHNGIANVRCGDAKEGHEEEPDRASSLAQQRHSPCPELLKRVQETPPPYRTAKAMKPTIDRLKKRIQDGTEPSPRRKSPPNISKVVEAELAWRGLRSFAQRDTFFRELALEYSRILAGSRVCLMSMWVKMMSDLHEECMEIRRDLTPGPCKEETKPLTPFEALLRYSQDCGNDSSASSDCSDSDVHHGKKQYAKLRGQTRKGSPVGKNEDLELPPLKIGNDEQDKPTTGLMTPVTSPAGKQSRRTGTPPVSPRKRLRDDGEGVWDSSRPSKNQKRVGAVSRIVQASLRRRIGWGLGGLRAGKDVTAMAQDIVDFHARGWKKRLRAYGQMGFETEARKGKKQREHKRQQVWCKVVADMLGSASKGR